MGNYVEFLQNHVMVSELKHKCNFLFYFVFGYKNKKVYLRLDVSNFVRVWKITTQRKFWWVINSKNNNNVSLLSLSQSPALNWIRKYSTGMDYGRNGTLFWIEVSITERVRERGAPNGFPFSELSSARSTQQIFFFFLSYYK
jgi:hypothetical protein